VNVPAKFEALPVPEMIAIEVFWVANHQSYGVWDGTI